VRNTFGRLWWRAYVLRDEADADPWHLLRRLPEDALVQIMERPALSGCPRVARAVARCYPGDAGQSVSRELVMRELTKRVLRVAGTVPLEAIPQGPVDAHVESAYREVIRVLTHRSDAPREMPGGMPYVAGFRAEGQRQAAAEPSAPSYGSVTGVGGSGSQTILETLLSASDFSAVGGQPLRLAPTPTGHAMFPPPVDRNIVVTDAGTGKRWLWHFSFDAPETAAEGSSGTCAVIGAKGYLMSSGAQPGDIVRMFCDGTDQLSVALIRGGTPA
jgi:hypothetical protein